MCIYVCAPQPLFIAYMLESLHPRVGGPINKIEGFDQHFDIILENHGDEDVEELLILHQRRMHPAPASVQRGELELPCPCPQITDTSTWLGDMPFRTRPNLKGTTLTLHLRSADKQAWGATNTDPEPQKLQLARVERVEFPGFGLSAKEYFDLFEAEESLPTVLSIRLERALRPFDPDRTDRTYIIRLQMTDVAATAVCAEPLELRASRHSRAQHPVLLKQTFETKGPEFLQQSMVARLWAIADDPEHPHRNAAATLVGRLVDEWILNPERVTHIHDHRIALVTSAQCMLIDSHIHGGLTFWQRREVIDHSQPRGKRTPPDRWLNIWTWGPAWDQEKDPTAVAMAILDILRKYPGNAGPDGHRVEILAPVCGRKIPRDSLIAILNALREEGLVLVDQTNQLWRIAARAGPPISEAALRQRIRRQLVETQRRRKRPVREFDEQPFMLVLGLATSAVKP